MQRNTTPQSGNGDPHSRGAALSRKRAWAVLAMLALGAAAVVSNSTRAPAQGWGGWIPWGGDQRPPVPRESVRPPVPVPQPPPQQAPPPGYSAPPGYSPPPAANSGNRPPICVQLEQRLFAESRNGSARDLLPRLENDIRQAERAMRGAQDQLERSNCYEYEFLVFGKSLRRTPACQSQAAQVDTNKRRMAELDAQRQQIIQSGGRSLQDDLILELARNNCGPSYQQQASRLSSNRGPSLWQDEESGPGGGNRFSYGATFRTVCVRLCDGAFFPVSFSTLQNQFDRDQDVCQQKCAAPAELYYHPQNPGQGIEQAISHKTRQPYTTLRTAFRFKKEFVAGCSCKAAEFSPPGAPSPGGPAPATITDRRAEAFPAAGGPPQQNPIPVPRR